MNRPHRPLVLSVVSLILLTGCGPSVAARATQTAEAATATAASWTATPTKTLTPTATTTPTSSPMPTDTQPPNPWDRYVPRTMAEIIAAIDEENDLDSLENNNVYLEMSPYFQLPSVVQMTFIGEYRAVTEPRSTIIPIWLSTFIPQLTPQERGALFATEVLFAEDGVEYGIPVQASLIEYMKVELQPGDEVSLYLIWIAASKMDHEIDLIFLVNAY